mmetsp:Transcript_30624/g.46993  ORF Transcript_30624/g.46993 Transcript_30624/m.46993 type:complete len:291 (-) Transcript_30624:51-923(-)
MSFAPFSCTSLPTANAGLSCVNPPCSSRGIPEQKHIIEGAFVHPSHANISESAMIKAIHDNKVKDDETVASDEHSSGSAKNSGRKTRNRPQQNFRSWDCCKSNEAVVVTQDVQDAKARADAKKKRAELFTHRLNYAFDSRDYSKIPKGILVYQLDTSLHLLRLLKNSVPVPEANNKVTDKEKNKGKSNSTKSKNQSKIETNTNNSPSTLLNKDVLEVFLVKKAKRGRDSEGRTIDLLGLDGSRTTIIAYNKKIATDWIDAINNMKDIVTQESGATKFVNVLTEDVLSLYK